MKTKNTGFRIGIMLMVALIFQGCNSSAENVTDAQENVDVANEELRIANEEYLADIQNYKMETSVLMAQNDSIILDLKSKIKSNKDRPYAFSKSEIESLELENEELRKKMNDYEGEGKDNWTIFKEEFKHDLDELGSALKNMTINNTR